MTRADDGAATLTAFAAKDNFDVAGEASGCGCATPPFLRASRHAEAVRLLLDAGHALVGTTHMPQFAFGGWGTNALVDAPMNPWDAEVDRVSGGSSGGSAVAVAAGIVDLALGSDTGGSVRIPAALCGVVGFKPSERTISADGLRPLAWTLDVVGLLGRRVRDVARAFDRLAHDHAASAAARTAPLRVGVADWPGTLDVHADVGAAFETAVDVLPRLGATVQRVRLPWPPHALVAEHGAILGYEAARLYGGLLASRRVMLDPAVARRIAAGLEISDAEYVEALHTRLQRQREYRAATDEVDVLVMPTTPVTAPPRADVDESSLQLSTFTRAANLLDLAALSVPCGFDRRGLPIGLQLVAPPGREHVCLALAADFEAATRWHERVPPLHVSREA